jgi:uncharacterized protein
LIALKFADTHIAIFCKAPVAGRVKTRLIEAYGENGATDIYVALAQKTLATVNASREAFAMSASLWAADDTANETVQRWSTDNALPTYAQHGIDLGARMLHCLQTMLRAGHQRVLLIGTDCPAFTLEHLGAAAAALSGECPWVFTPTEDGGYVLVGTTAADAAAFTGIAWSTDAVMQQTRAALRANGLRWAETATLWDVDLAADVERARRAGLI